MNNTHETFVKISEYVDNALSILSEIPESCSHNGLVDDVADVLCALKENYIKPSLMKKQRNCERFLKFTDASKAYIKECPTDWRGERIMGYVEWLFDEYKEKK
jgi:hypothetical protein